VAYLLRSTSLLLGICLLSSSLQADVLYVDFSRGGGIVDRFDSTGNTSRLSRSNVQKFSPAGTGTIISATITQHESNGDPYTQNLLADPNGLAFDRSGNLYVANNISGTSGTIVKIATDGTPSTFAQVSGNPVGLAFDKFGNLYVSAEDGAGITRIAPDGSSTIFAHGSNFSGLAFDAAGNLYAASQTANTIAKFTPAGKESLFANTDLSNPAGIAFDSQGNLYVANVGGASVPNPADQTIAEFTPTGAASIFASGLTNYPLDLAFTNDAGQPLALPIPEPGILMPTLAVMISLSRLRPRLR
jgi:secreted PhoX family phosphatase